MYKEIEHTADYAIWVSSGNAEGLFLDAARGMYALTGGRVEATAGERRVRLRAPDIETLLVEWLEELAFLLEMEGQMAREMSFVVLHPTNLVAELHIGLASGVTRLIKAVTFHDLEIRSSDEGYQTTIVFDV